MKTIINENQRGLRFKNGIFCDYLAPGSYKTFSKTTKIEVVDVRGAVPTKRFDLDVLLQNEKLAKEVSVIDVADQTLALRFVDGRFAGVLCSGRYAFFSVFEKNEYRVISMAEEQVSESVPPYILKAIPSQLLTKIEVGEHQKARLYFNKKLQRLLDSGTYFFWNNGKSIEFELVDTRLMTLDVSGQEILTADKVALRINFVCNYKITDYIKIKTQIDDYEEQIHIMIQLALRDYIGRYRFDEILDNKDEISAFVGEKLREISGDLFVDFSFAGVKDVILPGEIRQIMNTVLVAEKKAQANVITRREEVASTRSLLNTAKLMDENKTLYKLKELEYLERICENVGNISVSGGDMLGQLSSILRTSQ